MEDHEDMYCCAGIKLPRLVIEEMAGGDIVRDRDLSPINQVATETVGCTRLTRLTSARGPALFAKCRTGSQVYNVPILRSEKIAIVFELTPVLCGSLLGKGVHR